MRTVLRRIEPVSLAKVYAAVYAIIAFVFAIPAGCALSVVGSLGDSPGLGAGVGLFAIVLYPLFGAVGGFLAGLITGFVYNLVADRVGGVELEFDDWGEADLL
ncbi:MAG: hypothetical protein AAGI52_08340 [Bacteroidota bacterium]